MTGEKGADSLTRHGIEAYVSDCVIELDHHVREDISTRRLRVVKDRGSSHGTNVYPFFISERGIVVQPITSVALLRGLGRTGIDRGRPPGPHVGGRLLPGFDRPGQRHGWNG